MVSIEMPDKSGVWDHVLLGFDNAETYVHAGGSFGAVLGRYANRIDGGRFTLDGEQHQLSVNDGGNTLHGGAIGFGNCLWTTQDYNPDAGTLVLSLVSPDGDQGFPGMLAVQATYRLEAGALSLTLRATTSKATIINLSAHPYFNLAGAAAGDCLSNEIRIAADRFLATDQRQIPTGESRNVKGTAFDFRHSKRIASDIHCNDDQLLAGRGYDHCFVISGQGSRFMASAHDEASGRMLKLFSDQPALQFYTGNTLSGTIIGRGGFIYRQSAGFAFEAQDFPDAPNHLDFPSTVLRPGELYHRTIRYEFSTLTASTTSV
jgi:aldose 1-epimerase